MIAIIIITQKDEFRSKRIRHDKWRRESTWLFFSPFKKHIYKNIHAYPNCFAAFVKLGVFSSLLITYDELLQYYVLFRKNMSFYMMHLIAPFSPWLSAMVMRVDDSERKPWRQLVMMSHDDSREDTQNHFAFVVTTVANIPKYYHPNNYHNNRLVAK